MTTPLLAAEGLVKDYAAPKVGWFGRAGTTRILDGVSFTLAAGETLGLVGESGSGKSTTGRLIMRLLPTTEGAIRWCGEDIATIPLLRYRRDVQMIFQEPGASLNPAYRVRQTLDEVLRISAPDDSPADRRLRIAQGLAQVGLDASVAERLPHQMSGGQQQRIGIARALAAGPRLIVADEPVSALDVSVQAQVLNLLRTLKDQLGLSYLFIAHDLAVVKQISERVAVMYAGRIVEIAASRDLYTSPAHPYTRILLAAIPRPRGAARPAPTGDTVDAAPASVGCPFAPRCPDRIATCDSRPPLREIAPGHQVACHVA